MVVQVLSPLKRPGVPLPSQAFLTRKLPAVRMRRYCCLYRALYAWEDASWWLPLLRGEKEWGGIVCRLPRPFGSAPALSLGPSRCASPGTAHAPPCASKLMHQERTGRPSM